MDPGGQERAPLPAFLISVVALSVLYTSFWTATGAAWSRPSLLHSATNAAGVILLKDPRLTSALRIAAILTVSLGAVAARHLRDRQRGQAMSQPSSRHPTVHRQAAPAGPVAAHHIARERARVGSQGDVDLLHERPQGLGHLREQCVDHGRLHRTCQARSPSVLLSASGRSRPARGAMTLATRRERPSRAVPCDPAVGPDGRLLSTSGRHKCVLRRGARTDGLQPLYAAFTRLG